jgi:hypothetical protein
MIVSIEKSTRKGKRFMATYKDGDKTKTIHFGSEGATTYLDGASDLVRENYLKRHLANKIEKRLIENNIISPATLSARLLWGETRSLETNLKALNKLLKK